MNEHSLPLCCPDREKSCFACCPPIRKAGYEHIEYRNIINRILLENTRQFDRSANRITPITGFSCWALGYIDREFKRIGCLLHPAQNKGKDMRHRIDYGEKCRRETCPEEKVFSGLSLKGRNFWLHLADGLDSFSYSSRKINPLFRMMEWGKNILTLIENEEQGRVMDRASFFSDYRFFTTDLSPGGAAYLINRLTDTGRADLLKSDLFRIRLESYTREKAEKLRAEYGVIDNGVYVHLLYTEPDFSDFLRISAGIRMIRPEDAAELKNSVDEDLEKLKGDLL